MRAEHPLFTTLMYSALSITAIAAYNPYHEITHNLSSDGWNQLSASCGLFAISIILILFMIPVGAWLNWIGWRLTGLFFFGAVIFGYIGHCTRNDNSAYYKQLQREEKLENERQAFDEYIRQQFK